MLEILSNNFGHSSFKDGQLDAIFKLLLGHNLLAVMPTGVGKSLIYQYVALLKGGITIVVSPLIALMKDQVDNLSSRGIPATYINSSLPPTEQLERLEQITSGKYKLVYVAPERLRQYFFLEEMLALPVDLLVVDEAHCISQWGHDFRPDYLHIAQFREAIGNPITAALTATATQQVRNEIISLLSIPEAYQLVTGFNRPNISLEVQRIPNEKTYIRRKIKYAKIAELLIGWKEGAAIVYVGTRKDTESVAWFLRERVGVLAKHYHGDMEPVERKEVQEAFVNGDVSVIVATNAFGMGIDRPDVRLIIHHTIPGSLEAYYQEVGRAGRDGKSSRAVLLYHQRDKELQNYFIEKSTLSYFDLTLIYNALKQLDNGSGRIWVKRTRLSEKCGFDKEGVKVRIGLQRLEEAGVIEQSYYEGLHQLILLREWKSNLINQVMIEIQNHYQRKKQLLTKMIEYAENKAICRRKFILGYFGDSESLTTTKCCDLCSPRSFKIIKSPLGQTILECLSLYPGQFGRMELASFLCGTLDIGHLHKKTSFGVLAAYGEKKVREEIDKLLRQREIKHDERGYLIVKPKNVSPKPTNRFNGNTGGTPRYGYAVE